MIDIYDEMHHRGLVRSMRQFSTDWCRMAPNYLAEHRTAPSLRALVQLGLNLTTAGHADLAKMVLQRLFATARQKRGATP